MGYQIDCLGMPQEQELTVHAFGAEDDGRFARWGPGIREPHILHLVTEGGGFFNGHRVSAGQGFWIRPNQRQEYFADETDPWHYMWITFSGACALPLLFQCGLSPENPVFCFSRDEAFEESFRRLFENGRKSASGLCGLGVLYRFLDCFAVCTPTAKGRGRGYVGQSLQYLNVHYHEPIRIAELAARLYIDEGYLYNLFMLNVGVSPREYLTVLRIRRAQELLQNTDMPVSEVARSVGYTDPQQFSRFFKTREGMSPSDYRHLGDNHV